jgi:hypothetical protein
VFQQLIRNGSLSAVKKTGSLDHARSARGVFYVIRWQKLMIIQFYDGYFQHFLNQCYLMEQRIVRLAL